MGSRSNSRRSRGTKRGLASFVSFVVLFALALGQGSSLIALADDARSTALPSAQPTASADESSGDSVASSDDRVASAPRTAPKPSQLTTASSASSDRTAGILSHGGLHGGDVTLDFVAAGPFTYDHTTGLGTHPQFGYDNRNISKTNGVVESLEGGDFACGDLVTFFVAVGVEEDAEGSGSVQLDMSFGAETTGQPGIGFDDIVSWGINSPDNGNVDLDGNETVVQNNETLDTAGYDEIKSQFTVSNLNAGETAIVRITVHLACDVGGTPTGNILNAIDAARIVGGDRISVGQETVPMKQVGGIAAAPAISIVKTCDEFVLEGGTITYEIVITNTGNETLEDITVEDTILGDLSDDFVDTLAPGDSDSATIEHETTGPADIHNVVTVEANGVISSTAIDATDDCDTRVLNPDITVTKTCPEFAQVGDTITYTIRVTNSGDEALEGITVDDTILGDLSADFVDTLAPGAFDEQTFEYEVTGSADLNNVVTVDATGVDSEEAVSDTANCPTDILNPDITVTKTCPEFAQVGDTITYTIRVTNSGDEALEGITVDDTILGDLSADFVDTLAPGAFDEQTFEYEVTGSADLNNVVTVDATGVDSEEAVSDTANCPTDILNPDITVTKTCPEFAQVGDTITYTIRVTNSGDEALEGITVDDTILGDLSADFVDTLAPGAFDEQTFEYEVTGSADLNNVVTVDATGVDSEEAVSDTANCPTDILNPDITVTKTCPEFAQVGDTITYTIRVTNSGDEALEGITVDDTILGDLSADFVDTLAPGAFDEQTFEYEVTGSADLNNVVTVDATGVDSEEAVSDTANCPTDILNPDITVTKTCPEFAQVGDTITYTIRVTNSGDEALEGITVDDTILGDLSADFVDTLAPGAFDEQTFEYEVTGSADLNNVVTVDATGVDSEEAVSDTANCPTAVLVPAINIVKDGPELVHRGDTITYTFEVTNPGEVELFDVELTDPICDTGTIVPGADVDSGLAVGEVWHFTCLHLVTTDDPDPIPNTATVRGDTEEGEGGDEVTDTDDHVVDIIAPAIDIVKTVDEEVVPVGTTVTYTYVITNTGDTTLYEISVDDDILGHIGDIAVLEPGDSVTLTKDFVVGTEPVINVGTAEGEDVLGRSVSADDDAIVTPIAGENPPNPPNNPPTPFTGSDAGRLGLITMVLFGIGVTVVAATRRRRSEREAA